MRDSLKKRFDQGDSQFDYKPIPGHRERFERKLINHNSRFRSRFLKSYSFWYATAAAVLILLVSVVSSEIENEQQQLKSWDLADVSENLSHEAAEYQSSIEVKLSQIDKENPNIQENLQRLNHLEQEYQLLKKALSQNFGNQKVIMSMIQNYKNRLIVLENMLLQIETIEANKNNPNLNRNV